MVKCLHKLEVNLRNGFKKHRALLAPCGGVTALRGVVPVGGLKDEGSTGIVLWVFLDFLVLFAVGP